MKNCKQHAEANLRKFESIKEDIIDIYDEEVENILENTYSLIHGEVELYFSRKILANLKRLNKNSSYFNLKRNSINYDESAVNILSNFSNYADTPQCLIKFLQQYCKVEVGNLEVAN